jgi:hypothetical protein
MKKAKYTVMNVRSSYPLHNSDSLADAENMCTRWFSQLAFVKPIIAVVDNETGEVVFERG